MKISKNERKNSKYSNIYCKFCQQNDCNFKKFCETFLVRQIDMMFFNIRTVRTKKGNVLTKLLPTAKNAKKFNEKIEVKIDYGLTQYG